MTNLPVYNSAEEEAIRAAFRGAGLRITPQRLALLRVMRDQGGFQDAEAWYRLAQLRGANLSLATVYRTLSLFKTLNLVEGRIVETDQEREEYRYRALQESYTLTCKQCGAIVPVESDIVDAFRAEVTRRLGVTIVTAHSCFVGYCAACTAALAAEDNKS